MQKVTFNSMEIDALGEMMNISLGSSATAVSNMLDHRVDITTPQVSVIHVDDFTLGNLEPAMGVKIQYVEGLDGSNIMLLRRSDVKVIVDILMGGESEDEEFELNELNISAVCEVMNQMMGAAATAMSDFLGFPVNISTPEPFELNNLEEFKARNLPQGADQVVVVRFSLKIENALESEFMNVMSVPLAKDLLKGLGLSDDEEEIGDLSDIIAADAAAGENTGNRQMSQEEIEQLLMGGLAAEPEPAPASNKQMSQDEIEAMLSGMLGGEPEPEPAPSSNKQMSQDEIEAMLSGMLGGEPEPEPAPASNKQMSQDEIEKMLSGMMSEPAPAPAPAPAAPAPAPAPAPAAPAAPVAAAPVPPVMPPQMQPPQMEGGMYYPGYMGYPPMYYPYPQQPQAPVPEPKRISTKPVAMPEMEATASLGKEQAENLDLIMDVPLQVTVEIGRTHRKVQDILEFSKGSLVVLDRLAGDQVDLFVNGKCIARGDVVVVDDNFGVRITEVLQKGIDITASK